MALESKEAYDKALIFNGDNYDYWKDCMCIHMTSRDKELWNVIVTGPFIPTRTDANGIVTLKPKNKWTTDEERKWSYDLKARNILISSLGIDEYFRISNCRSAKNMWDTLEIAHEGNNDVKQSKINSLTQEFELFRMKVGETISDMQKRFTYFTNRLHICLINRFQMKQVLIKY
jgi:hypothetical protein